MSRPIFIKVERPEGYEDVADEIMLDDFLRNAVGWQTELVDLDKSINVQRSSAKCSRCEEWSKKGLSDTCPACDLAKEKGVIK